MARLLIVLSCLTLLSCSKEETWTEAEKQNAQYILMAFQEKQEATQIGNAGQAFTSMSPADFDNMRAHLRKAYEYAQLVQDPVLDKAHPELRQHWHAEYIEGMRLRLRNFDQGDVGAEIKGQMLMDQFGDWWNGHKQDIRIPK